MGYFVLSFVFVLIFHFILLLVWPEIYDISFMSILGPLVIAYFSFSFSCFLINKYFGSCKDA